MSRYQPFNDLPASQYEALKRDVEARGIVNPILVDEHDKTIDGHQRRRVAAELGIDCPRIVLADLSEDDKLNLALALNTFRRHLAGVERSKALQQMANLGMSVRRIAAATGVPPTTVQRDLKAGVPNGTPDEEPPRRTGADGKSYPASKPRKVDPETGEIEEQRLVGPARAPEPEAGEAGDREAPGAQPGASPASTIADRLAESDAGYRSAYSTQAHAVRSKLLNLDPERCASVQLPEDRSDAEAFIRDLRSWLDRYEAALIDTNRLKAVQ